ncbi:MAG TPA: hypothetical protein VJV79_02245 [Polyangiaceae bacterium]|nr:hypothetical protein [Polyangiaceae bacterium]
MMRRCLLGFVLGSAAWPASAVADLAGDVRELTAAHAPLARVVRLKPRLLERGERLPLSIPPELLNPKDGSCTTVSLLGVVGVHFAVRFSEMDPSVPNTAFPEASSAGSSELTRCGIAKPFLSGAYLEMRSPRGVIETLVSNSDGALPRLSEVLSHRDAGNQLSLGDPGPRPALPARAARLLRLSKRAQREAAKGFEQQPLQAGAEGTGAESLMLGRGCHQLSLLAEAAPASSQSIDLDAELLDGDSGARLDVDRAEDADAALGVCLGAPTRVELRFIGAAAEAALILTHTRWDLPPGLPSSWGAEAQGRLARLARNAHLRLLSAPIYSSLGVQGSTELPLELEPGACYSVLLVPLRGEPRNLSLSVRAHVAGEVPRGSSDAQGSAVSFCARGAKLATLDIDSQGAGLAWLLAVWQSGRSAPGVTLR